MSKKAVAGLLPGAPLFAHGDRVEIKQFLTGRIVELRGNLGPGGEMVYRVRYGRKPGFGYIEVLESQIRPAEPQRSKAESPG